MNEESGTKNVHDELMIGHLQRPAEDQERLCHFLVRLQHSKTGVNRAERQYCWPYLGHTSGRFKPLSRTFFTVTTSEKSSILELGTEPKLNVTMFAHNSQLVPFREFHQSEEFLIMLFF